MLFTKSLSKRPFFLVLFLSICLCTSCSDDDPIIDNDDIVQKAIKTSDLSTLVVALQKADLVSALQAEGPFTVFAPIIKRFKIY